MANTKRTGGTALVLLTSAALLWGMGNGVMRDVYDQKDSLRQRMYEEGEISTVQDARRVEESLGKLSNYEFSAFGVGDHLPYYGLSGLLGATGLFLLAGLYRKEE
jgi:hypothetical protein